jgi:hypothetical protein
MPSMTMTTIGFQEYQPDPEDLCSLCGGNVGREKMIEGKDKIHICFGCVAVLVEIKNDREAKRREEIESALRTCLAGTGAGITPLAAKGIYDSILKNEIPHIHID